MRIITGTARGTKLISLDAGTKPLSDRAKSALFSIIGEKVVGSTILDLYAGSGALGLESLSRGASYAIFVDIARKAIESVELNIAKCHFENKADIVQYDAIKYVSKFTDEKFDIIFISPPYPDVKFHIVKKAQELVAPNGILIFEHHKDDNFAPLELLEKVDDRSYGIVKFEFYKNTTV